MITALDIFPYHYIPAIRFEYATLPYVLYQKLLNLICLFIHLFDFIYEYKLTLYF
jgi:hypothetical protein